MPRIHNQIRKAELAMALARGGTVVDWAQLQGISERTAYNWSRSPEVVEQVEAIRTAVLDRTVGLLSESAVEAVRQITTLAREASSESVRVQAARAVLGDLMAVSGLAPLERRLVELERRLPDPSHTPAAGLTVDRNGVTGQ